MLTYFVIFITKEEPVLNIQTVLDGCTVNRVSKVGFDAIELKKR